jgi:hypothetical protein
MPEKSTRAPFIFHRSNPCVDRRKRGRDRGLPFPNPTKKRTFAVRKGPLFLRTRQNAADLRVDKNAHVDYKLSNAKIRLMDRGAKPMSRPARKPRRARDKRWFRRSGSTARRTRFPLGRRRRSAGLSPFWRSAIVAGLSSVSAQQRSSAQCENGGHGCLSP